jgi:hypothetical protein
MAAPDVGRPVVGWLGASCPVEVIELAASSTLNTAWSTAISCLEAGIGAGVSRHAHPPAYPVRRPYFHSPVSSLFVVLLVFPAAAMRGTKGARSGGAGGLVSLAYSYKGLHCFSWDKRTPCFNRMPFQKLSHHVRRKCVLKSTARPRQPLIDMLTV